MKNILIIFSFIFLFGCSSYKTIGNYKYKTRVKRSNIGEFEALIYRYKLFINKDNDTIFSVLQKAQKLHLETKKDSVFAIGKLKVKKEIDRTYIITKQINMNGYDNFIKIDSIVRFYEQNDNGNVKFIKANYYRNGVEKSYPNN